MAGIFWLAASRPRGELVTILPTSTQGEITVFISGAAVNPGIYIFTDGSRVNTAINAAGGFIGNAQKDSINQAALLKDGQQISVP